eukprot:7141201-Pyramimonas_sp.AAC.1
MLLSWKASRSDRWKPPSLSLFGIDWKHYPCAKPQRRLANDSRVYARTPPPALGAFWDRWHREQEPQWRRHPQQAADADFLQLAPEALELLSSSRVFNRRTGGVEAAQSIDFCSATPLRGMMLRFRLFRARNPTVA